MKQGIKMKPVVSIIILTKDNESTIGNCLAGIFSQQYTSFEVLVIDSRSKDSTHDIVQSYGCRFITYPFGEFSHGKARNFGVAKAKGSFIVFISPDAVPASTTWLSALLNALKTSDAVYGRHLPAKNATPLQRIALSRNYGRTPLKKKCQAGIMNSFFSNANSAFRKEILEAHPFFQDILICEDIEISKRLLLQGYVIFYEPLAMVFHSHNFSLKHVFQRYFDIGRAYRTIWFDQPRMGTLGKEGVHYLSYEWSALLKKDQLTWIPYAFFYNCSKLFGYLMGRYIMFLPRELVKKISLYS
ncbi:MAG: glycosyltransferase [Candidatus Woesearchaeota archaeon]|jgi:rhamnosyltransferase|nr:glycosyltransferase [Candidatus Woesearchaeota archaeon]